MEWLLLALLLLLLQASQQELSTVKQLGLDATPAPQQELSTVMELELDMAPTAFDDQYQGCSKLMEEEVAELNRAELSSDRQYAEAWALAAEEWRSRRGRVPAALVPEQALALLAYTQQGALHRRFNAAVRQGGRSRGHYLRSFPFKALHFLLSRALAALGAAQPPRCRRVYRGVRGVRFRARPGSAVRFGHFASASTSNGSAAAFGRDSFFCLRTCYGVAVRDFSFYPEEDEVLIPPFESFEVLSVSQAGGTALIELRSRGGHSNYNCEFVKEKRCQSHPCPFSSGRSIRGAPPHLWVLLAAAALAPPGGH
ncbi:erythroblast NAD(P)(+)--arginine ADP-ribosyltransferase-like [Pogoniulus pusillus]|uniref:erythroblast NAD(P)(+)--arginine ADP-ribosyltransferase-like n=1 Tax=Pogoniulus pusillus TaxID=488313 RepID=UPI0030B99D60